MSSDITRIRSVQPSDAAAIETLGFAGGVTNEAMLVADRAGRIRAAGVVDPAGLVTEPEHPAIRIHRDRAASELDTDLKPLILRLIESAAAEHKTAGKLFIGWDPLDVRAIQMLEAIGFRPSGTPPYATLAGGHVEYITGYQDATGSTIDLVLDLARL